MTGGSDSTGPTRLSVLVNDEVKKVINDSGLTATEFVRRAASVYDLVVEVQRAGGTVYIEERKNGPRYEVRLIP